VLYIQKDTVTTLNLSAVTFLVLLGLSIIAPILPYYAETFNVNYTLVGLVISAFGIARMFLDLPTGFLTQKYNKKGIMLTGLILVTLSSILAGFAPNYWILLVARIIEGMGSALYVTTATVYIAIVAKPERRGRLMGIYSGFLLLGSIFGPTFGGFIANSYCIRAPFYAYAIIVTVGVIPTLILPKVGKSSNGEIITPREFPRKAWMCLKDRNFILVIPAIFSLFFIRTGVRSTLVPLYGMSDLGLGENDIGLLLTFAGIATAVTMVPIGSISDRTGRRTPLIMSLLLTIPVTLWIPFSSNLLYLTLSLMIYGAMVGLSGPISAYITDLSPPDQLEIYMGMYRTIGDVGFVVGPLLMGFVADLTSKSVISGGSTIDLVGWPPFAVAATILLLSGLILFKAPNSIQGKIPVPDS
jgi:DHA1 family multidrug resistance protein-like MFS transporter